MRFHGRFLSHVGSPSGAPRAAFESLCQRSRALRLPVRRARLCLVTILLRSPPCWTVNGRNVFVCENANLLAIAADELGLHCAPLICTDGMPAAAQRTLLNQLSRAGACLQYHGDFDWPGLRIGNHVMREYSARPWRFGAAEYTAAIASAARPGRQLEGPEVVASWDDALALAMHRHQLSIAEESLAESLLQDLDVRRA
jgi:uncharacterized protein (TIGR02679 family)